VGDYVLTQNDLIAGLSRQTHPDIIALADHSIDIHGSHASGGEMRQPYGVPYRCLIPRATEPAGGVPGGQLQLAGRVELPAVAHHDRTGSGRRNGCRAGKTTEAGSA